MKKTIMFFGAHADDMEIRAAGTMRKFVEEGYEAVSVMMTNNLLGAYPDEKSDKYLDALGPAETQEIRHREAREAADLLGVKLVFLDFKEGAYFNGTKVVRFGTEDYDARNTIGREPLIVAQCLPHCIADTAKVLVEHSPEIVIAHNIANGNPEHCAAAHLTHSAFRQAAGKAGLKELWMTCRVQSPSDILFLSPDALVDITKYHEMKLEALRRHKSQRIDLERVTNTDKYWGRVAGTTYAEAFRTVIRRV